LSKSWPSWDFQMLVELHLHCRRELLIRLITVELVYVLCCNL